MATKQETIEVLCQLVTKVGEEVFMSQFSHDCFCPHGPHAQSPTCVSIYILDFITQAVEEKIEREHK